MCIDDYQSLKVTAILGSNVALTIDNTLHFDSILSYAVTQLENYPIQGNIPKIIPLPLYKIWESDNGLPLWASTNFIMSKNNIVSREYWHKRFPSQHVQDWCKKPNTPKSRGRFKEYRIPVEVATISSAYAYCVGDKSKVEKLLSVVTHLGCKTSQGKGKVLKWEVEKCDVTINEILKQKPLPLSCLTAILSDNDVTPPIGYGAWTPPYWYKPWHEPIVKINEKT